MDKKKFLENLKDTGLEDYTLEEVLKCFFKNAYFDVHILYLSTDKRIAKIDQISNDYLFEKEAVIFKAIVKKLKSYDNDRLLKLNIPPEELEKLSSLSIDQIIDYISRSGIGFPNKTGIKIFNMSKLDDMWGSHQDDVFEEHIQKTFASSGKIYTYTKRIYLNLPFNNNLIDFLTIFKLKCIEAGIPSKMKGMGSSGSDYDTNDTTIIYTNDYYFFDHISIIESIIKEYPELFKNFGTPVISGSRVISNDGNCYYTVSSGILADNTSNGYYNKLYGLSFIILYYYCKKMCNKYNMFQEIMILSSISSIEKRKIIKDIVNNIDDETKTKMMNVNLYREIVKNVSSYLRFKDFTHCDVPLYQDEIFINFVKLFNKNNGLGNDNDSNSNSNSNSNNDILYHIEEIYDELLQEFLNSDNSIEIKTEEFVNKLVNLKFEFHKEVRKSSSFITSDRFKQALEFLKTLPDVKPYVNNKNYGDYLNMVYKKRYYVDIFYKLNDMYNIHSPKKHR